MAVQGAEQVAAQTHLDACLGQDFERLLTIASNGLDLGDRFSRKTQSRAFVGQRFIGHQGRHHKGVVFFHDLSGCGIHQVAVLDRAHAALHRTADRARGVGVSHDVGARVARLFDGGADFFFRKAQEMDWIVWRSDTTRGHDFDLGGTLHDLFANG